MDPLSIAASIAGLGTLAYQIIGYLGQVKAGGKDRMALCKEVTHLWLSIAALQEQLAPDVIADDKIPHSLLPLFEPDGIIKEIRNQIEDLDKKIKTQSSHGRIAQTLAWPFTQKDVMQIIQRVQRLQTTLQAALTQSNHALAQDIYRDGQGVKKVIDETRLKELIDWISPLNFVAKQNMIWNAHHKGTCRWFLERDEFRDWREGENTVLFCPGIPGAGKTFLASIVFSELEELRARDEGGVKDAVVVMLYCKWDDPQSQSIDALLASIIKQIIQRYGTVPDELMDMFTKHNKDGTRPAREQLLSMLDLFSRRFTKLFIIVDGLDELREEKERLALLRTLTSRHVTSVNLMVTSRPIRNIVRHARQVPYSIYCDGCKKPDLTEQYHCAECEEHRNLSFDLCESCYDDGKRCGNKGHHLYFQYNTALIPVAAVEADLTTYVEWRTSTSEFLQQCVETKDGLMDKIVDTVVKANEGMFLLAKFNMDTLESKLSIKQVLAALKVLPKELDGTYTDAMHRIAELSDSTKETVMKFLSWVVFAEQPLHEREIEHALAVSDGNKDIDDENIIRAKVLADKCAGLVQFDESDCLRLVHYSAENFFSQNCDQWFPEGRPKITSTCLTYLLFDAFKSGACSGPSEAAEFDDRLEKYPLLRYASMNWGKHLRLTPNDGLYAQAMKLLTDPGCLATAAQALWYLENQNSASWSAKDGSGMHLAAHFGLTRLVEELIKQGHNPGLKDVNGATPLALAALKGSVEVVETLLKAGVSVNTVDNSGRAPLHLAILYGSDEVVKLLLGQKDIDINIAHHRWSHFTPLMVAAVIGHIDNVKLLLGRKEIQVNKESSSRGTTALILASQRGETGSVQLLLTHPAIDINHKDEGGNTALTWAAQEGYYSVAEALLDKGADTEVMQDGTNGTAIMRAIDNNQVSIVQLLLKRGANVHHTDCFDRGLLHAAAVNRRPEILRILLDFDKTLDVNMQDMHGKTTLHDIARIGHRGTAEILLEHGGDPTIKDSHGRTPIRVAREMDKPNMLELFRAARAQQKAQPGSKYQPLPQRTDTGTITQGPGRTDTGLSIPTALPLWSLAVANKFEELKERLPDASPEEINETEPDMGQAALHYAVTDSDANVVRLLVEHGADINLENRYGRTPLHVAALGNRQEAAKILLDAGADVDIVDQWGHPALVTAQSIHSTVGLMLIEKGASLEHKSLHLEFYLEWAARDGHEVAVRRLMEAGANVWSKDRSGKTPYMTAKTNGHEELAKLILQLAPQPSVTSDELGEVGKSLLGQHLYTFTLLFILIAATAITRLS